MSKNKACSEGDDFPFPREASPAETPMPEPAVAKPEPEVSKPGHNAPRPLPEPTKQHTVPGPMLGWAPRGQRFSKLSDAYLNITVRGSNNPFRQGTDHLCPPTSGEDGQELSPVASSGLLGSQDDLHIPSPSSAEQSIMRRRRSASFSSIHVIEKMPRITDKGDISTSSIDQHIEHELEILENRAHDTSESTIGDILAQYDGRTASVNDEQGNIQDYRTKTNPFISQPPQELLPADPPTDAQHACDSVVYRSEIESPVANTSVTDSQHLLDVDAQDRELEAARRAVVPLPLHVTHSHHGTDVAQDQHYAESNAPNPFVVIELDDSADRAFTHPETQGYKTYLDPPVQRDISRLLRQAGGRRQRDSHSLDRSNKNDNAKSKHALPEQHFTQSTLRTVSTEDRRIRNIKVVIGQDNHDQDSHNEDSNAENDHVMASDDADWVTEGTSDCGFALSTDGAAQPRQSMGYKKAGSSLADYSDDGQATTFERFGSRDQILQPPAKDHYVSYDIKQSKDSKFSILLPRKRDASTANAGRRIGRVSNRDSHQFRPQLLARNGNPYHEIGSNKLERPGRLVFNFDQNAPPRYQFRDSVSEYETAAASMKANYGTQKSDTENYLPRPVSRLSDLSNYNQQRTQSIGAQFDQSNNLEGDQISSEFYQESNPFSTPNAHANQESDMSFSIYAAERRRQRQEFQQREFAQAFSYCDPPSTSSVRSKFDFELLPLNVAQKINREQRDNGQTNEAETGLSRMKRWRSFPSTDVASSPIEPPSPAFFTDRDLSINFSPTNLDVDSSDVERGYYSSTRNRRRRTRSWLGYPNDTASSFGTPTVQRYPGQHDHGPAPTPGEHRRLHRRRPGFIAPDDYVSDRADRIRRYCFFIIIILSVLPFFGILALSGAFSEALKWATQGEVDHLTRSQRRFLKWQLGIEALVYTACAIAVVVFFGSKASYNN
ncbi:hypothetical protein GGS21DRAFT_547286 [Xylaria nigripes]|nr:hypothetical protein GGS21DRAFT_547286 [Xylaria nigripes]